MNENNSTALTLHDPTNEEIGRGAVALRNQVAQDFIEKTRGYWHLRSELDVHDSLFDEVSEGNWISEGLDAESEITRRKPAADAYFKFKITFFKFHRRADRTLVDLLPWRRPFTHADLDEEDTEQRFPCDLRKRALICAMNLIIQHNQWRHVRMKRWYQFLYTTLVLIVVLLWFSFGFDLSMRLVNVVGGRSLGAWTAPVAAEIIWIVVFIVLWGTLRFVARAVLERDLRDTTSRFKDANKACCDAVFRRLNDFNSAVRIRFTKYFLDIQQSQAKLEEVKKDAWLDRVRDAFRIALWEAKRIESMERFWQFQFERLRTFELFSDSLGNSSSISLSIGFILLSMGVVAIEASSWWSMPGALLVLFIASSIAWKFGKESRGKDLSFGMQDVVNVGFERDWKTFQSVRYYDQIADEFRKAKGDWRTEKLEQGR